MSNSFLQNRPAEFFPSFYSDRQNIDAAACFTAVNCCTEKRIRGEGRDGQRYRGENPTMVLIVDNSLINVEHL